ncbi:hypothetical protein N780_20115 [Pontibacillus chungwhensis BH030062]|uniref:Uncharacterized protein n=1 Tax=Pontibacillus chungwhensis BH030062 TaxID=1385513 RepID=A0A0A2UUB8_9BACI|nr:hypothetical protein [Pontibacillus chungwhensis]KGP91529.1 hypothetical protein N780_20115 [Pontibacillus chungwhensis BH030062]
MKKIKKGLVTLALGAAFSIGAVFTADVDSAHANPTTYGPYYTSFSGAELQDSNWGTLARKCENAVYDYGSSISRSSTYVCQWYQVIERRVTSTNGWIEDVSYSPYYIYNL